ncbi:tRNA (guanine(9)-N1)-methyltransferase OS=Cryptococcus neoformans var, neoformans serotype D (strain JEC21 / ATCC MYA-565) GN=TRM10 PE=3 SV=1 [Rhizoctonia solani AG-1 IB]|uniref:tRNA (guanine(9)-N1)-methyltransferase n=1 Tax=Thanatephorus cucumeris (strain AG1-IB / isolate 7/3/14) TaxID=1108050 RepID=A0A0B7FP53_THACB|nr:tRNA (guanine(9)-N1)-methyltransferase OS=Cryptococcus neoformans var, neoformans serotype D (strain JEC21 / ATCC MYA-565) GN=TRM10 PE=3 SV=1 [Rhizoctonia solani AG-1 IB]
MASPEHPTPTAGHEQPTGHTSPEPLVEPEPAPTLSKSAQKKLAKAERFAQLKSERRAREKEQKAVKRKEREERLAAGEDPGPSDAKKRRVSREGQGPVRPFNARIVIDLSFDEKMTEKEVGSLCSQLSYTYASHRRTRTPFSNLLFTKLSGRSRKQLDDTNDASYRRWKHTEWWDEDIDGLWNPPPMVAQPTPNDPSQAAEKPAEASGAHSVQGSDIHEDKGNPGPEASSETPDLPTSSEPLVGTTESTPSARLKQRRAYKTDQTPQIRSACPRESVVYLTADAEEEITELKEGETYVIGGIVDRNRYKNLCANKARDLQVRSARLPIGTYLKDMPTRKVLTVNQVFDILVHWVTTRNWEEAMQKVMPKRKFNANGKKGKHSQGQVADEEGGNVPNDEEEGYPQSDNEEPDQQDDGEPTKLNDEMGEPTDSH